MAAYALAEALSLSILRVDLSRVVSKYIGETEKNLDAIFARTVASALLAAIFDAKPGVRVLKSGAMQAGDQP